MQKSFWRSDHRGNKTKIVVTSTTPSSSSNNGNKSKENRNRNRPRTGTFAFQSSSSSSPSPSPSPTSPKTSASNKPLEDGTGADDAIKSGGKTDRSTSTPRQPSCTERTSKPTETNNNDRQLLQRQEASGSLMEQSCTIPNSDGDDDDDGKISVSDFLQRFRDNGAHFVSSAYL